MSVEETGGATECQTFEDLAASRRDWIEQILKPWCLQANLNQLRQADAEWLDIAGKVDQSATLWTWAWERFPALTHEGLAGVNETHRVQVALNDDSSFAGFPDNRKSLRGTLVLVDTTTAGGLQEHGPFSIDDIKSVSVPADT